MKSPIFSPETGKLGLTFLSREKFPLPSCLQTRFSAVFAAGTEAGICYLEPTRFRAKKIQLRTDFFSRT
jgi:hypothetical protein